MRDAYIPFEYPATDDGEFTAVLNEGQILLTRRLQLGLTIQRVADMSGIRFSQYQRLEGGERLFSGCSMKIGLAVCAALLLNPMDIIHPHVHPQSPQTLSRPPLFDPPNTHRAGRKKSRQDIMELIITGDQIIVPEEVAAALGRPRRIWYTLDRYNDRVLLSAENPGPTESNILTGIDLSIPAVGIFRQPSKYAVKCRPVRDRKGALFVLADLSTATPI
ncbi:MAG: helix-turn-helix transcriptional regulator [Lachnospiraceae bacterium]|nr:helix-turn-helix transcriptional regulator [Lachnospiraceae bacterium]